MSCSCAATSPATKPLLGLFRRPALRPAVATLTLAQEARELRCQRLARREVLLVLEQLSTLLELVDVRLCLVVGRDRFGHLLAVALRGLLELGRIDLRPEYAAETLTQRQRGTRARRERDVVRDGGPQTDRRNVGAVASIVEHTHDAGRSFVP